MAPPLFLRAQHEHDQEVQVLWGIGSQGPRANRKATSRETGAERSGERNRESTNRNRIRGDVSQGERAHDREALATKGRRRRSGECKAEREVSRGRSNAGRHGGVKGRTEGRAR